MDHKELIECGKRLFDAHPGAKFDSVQELLDVGFSSWIRPNSAVADRMYFMYLYSEYLVRFADEHKECQNTTKNN